MSSKEIATALRGSFVEGQFRTFGGILLTEYQVGYRCYHNIHVTRSQLYTDEMKRGWDEAHEDSNAPIIEPDE